MTRDELIDLLLVERYGTKPSRAPLDRATTTQVPIGNWSDSPAMQARRRADLAAEVTDFTFDDHPTVEQKQRDKVRRHLRRVA